MAPKRPEKSQPTTLTSGTPEGAPTPKLPRTAWKTGEQLEYLLSQWPAFISHQTAGKLDRFWPHVYDTWYKNWPINPTPQALKQHGMREEAILMLRSENNQRIRTWFHNQARPSSRTAKSDLRLNQNEKRKLAPAQAYCTYAWNSGLKETVIELWENQKRSDMFTDEDDPSPESIGAPDSGDHIPINFKLKVAKDAYNKLSPEEKKQVDERREEDRKKLYRSIQDIESINERDEKLILHQQNQPSVTKSLTRVLKNLEDQAGCVAHLMVGYIDPDDGTSSFLNLSQGRTDSGLEFRAFAGQDWENVIEKRFQGWALGIFGEKDSTRRSAFILSDASRAGKEGSSSAAGTSQSHRASTPEDSGGIVSGSRTKATAVNDGKVAGAPSIAPRPQPSEIARSVPFQASVPPEMFEAVEFVAPQQIFAPPESIESVNNDTTIFSSIVAKPPPLSTPSHVLEYSQTTASHQTAVSPTLFEAPRLAPPVFDHSQAVPPREAVVPPTIPEYPFILPSPILDFPQAATPCQIDVPPMVPETPHLVSPSFVSSSQPVISRQAAGSSIISEPPLAAPYPVPESSQPVTPHQVMNPLTVNELPSAAITSTILKPSRVEDLREFTEQVQVSNPPPAILVPQAVYKLRDQTSVATADRSRRDSIEGAPDVILTLCGSGYELASRFAQRDAPTASPSTTSSHARSPSATPTFEELVVPSSQQSIEGELAIPMEVELSDVNATPDGLTIATAQQSSSESSNTAVISEATTKKVSGRFYFAPRVVPDYGIDRSDFPSWLLERERLNYVLSVEAGDIWKKLITTWLRQERRLGFGINEKTGTTLSLKRKPKILTDYFKWHHNPTKGDSLVSPEFGDEVSAWWTAIQPRWRYKNEDPANGRNDYSYILSGRKKGVYLLILCLAWWDQAHGRYMEEEKEKRRKAARDAGKDETALDFGDIPEHESSWFNIVNDLIFVLELAQGWPVPTKHTDDAVEVAPTRRKRGAEGGDAPSRKKNKGS